MQIRSSIRSTIGFTLLLSSMTFLLWSVGCSEDEQNIVDETAPIVDIIKPIAGDFSTFSVNDSQWVVITAADPSGIEAVSLMCTFHDDSTIILAGDVEAIPDSAGFYHYHWITAAFANGSSGYLWASATDGVGNEGTTDTSIPVTVLNSDDFQPPEPAISISPYPQGRASIDNFQFDASLTTDDINSLAEILVRWDFNGDGIWDVNPDFDDPISSAAKKVYYTYAIPGTVMVALEVKNDYFPQSNTAYKELIVLPEGGDPKPPAPIIEIPAGIYPIGVVDVEDAGSGYNGYYENELTYNMNTVGADTMFVTITNSFNIDVNEVSNEYYVDFLDSASVEGLIAYDPYSEEQFVRWEEDGRILCELLGSSRIKYLNDNDFFDVDPDYADHPVTGVTYHGAALYATYYGLRLPTEYEWEIAARGNYIATNTDPAFIYPWVPSDQITPAYANFKESGDPFEGLDPTKSTTPIGSYNGSFIGNEFPTENAIGPLPGGGLGTYDQAGNVSEWVKDWYDRDTYLNMMIEGQTIDPQGPATGMFRVIRGGNFGDEVGSLRITKRTGLSPFEMTPKVGFRTVHTVFGK